MHISSHESPLVHFLVDGVAENSIENGAAGNQETGDRGYWRVAGFDAEFYNQWLNDPESR